MYKSLLLSCLLGRLISFCLNSLPSFTHLQIIYDIIFVESFILGVEFPMLFFPHVFTYGNLVAKYLLTVQALKTKKGLRNGIAWSGDENTGTDSFFQTYYFPLFKLQIWAPQVIYKNQNCKLNTRLILILIFQTEWK